MYPKDHVLSTLLEFDPDTNRKWIWIVIEEIADLEMEIIVWENRKNGAKGNDALTNYDGVDCLTTKQGHKGAKKSFYSHKFKTAGLRYSLATCIMTGDIVHIDGPHPPGDWPDIECFRKYLKPRLEPGERVEADDGYIGEDPVFVKASSGLRFMETGAQKKIRKTINLRHERFSQTVSAMTF